MKRNAMGRNLLRSIKNSIGRYIAIAMIIALGAGIFVGLNMTKADMVATGQKYTDDQNMFDLRLISSYGWSDDQLRAVQELDGLVDVEGMFYTDLIVNINQSDDDQVYRFYTIPETINRLVLLGGRMPENGSECLIDGYQNGKEILGKEVVIQENNEEDALDQVNCRTLTVVGYVRSPLYMDMNRGTTSVGNGAIKDCLYVLPETFDVDYYTEIHATIPGNYKIYSKQYNDAMDAAGERIKPAMEELAAQRLAQLIADAEEAYAEGVEEYYDGALEYAEGLHEAYSELKDAYYDLLDGEQEILDNEQKLLDGEKQIEDGKLKLKEGRVQLQNGRKKLSDAKADAYQQISDANAELMSQFQDSTFDMEAVNTELAAVNTELAAVNVKIIEIESGASRWDVEIANLDGQIMAEETLIQLAETLRDLELNKEEPDQSVIDTYNQEITQRNNTIADLKEQKSLLEQERENYFKEHEQELSALYDEQAHLEAEQHALEGKQSEITETLAMIGAGMLALTTQQNQMEAQFASAEAQLNSSDAQLTAAETQLEIQEKRISDGWDELEEGRAELLDGWKEYEDGLKEAKEELAEGRAELDDARDELADARKTIDDMTENTLHILDRNTNVGYASLDSSSDIVEGVSRVFPVFFLLVAALVCITTMTRMVDEERTQIGTLKALGYSNAAIISKYMLYAGSSAILGCGLGVLMGSIVFPAILWEAYKIMLFIDDRVVFTFDFMLCFVVVAAYTCVELIVTWYCCRRALEEVPAELIRPKAPAIGKPLIFEKMAFWSNVSFLNKVTIRNIFRYRQRLAMMLVGIGGCTALLLTGFGLRDSIVNIVDFQFEDVTTYDMEVYFEKGQTDKEVTEFRQEMKSYAENIFFYHQTSVEIQTEEQVREIYMIAAEEGIRDFIDFHRDGKSLDYPGLDELLLSSGVADALDIEAGDNILLRNSDMQTMELTVSGIYENYVYNYAILSPKTAEKHWGSTPENQMAFIKVREGQDVHQVSSEIVSMSNVMNVSVSDDLAFMVRNMMDALDLVIVVIVFCAALLAATVLYNLTNININERIREIATIKVLGFNAFETGMYIFKENLILSVMGTFVGLLFGKLLLDFVMSQIKINMVWFMARALPLSYLLSVVITILMAFIVDFVFYFKLQKINMAEALKSVE